jgi:hypothetical protein
LCGKIIRFQTFAVVECRIVSWVISRRLSSDAGRLPKRHNTARLSEYELVRATEMEEGYRVPPKFKCYWLSARCVPSSLPVTLDFPNS